MGLRIYMTLFREAGIVQYPRFFDSESHHVALITQLLKLQLIRLAAQRSDVICSMEPDLFCVRSAVSQDLSYMELKHDQHSLPFSSFCFSCPSVLSSNDNLFSGALRSH